MTAVEVEFNFASLIATGAVFLTLGVLLVYTARRIRMLWDWALRGRTYSKPMRWTVAAIILAVLGFALWGYYFTLVQIPLQAAIVGLGAAAIGAAVSSYGIWLSSRLTRRELGTPLSDALNAAPQRARTLVARRAAREILKRNQSLAQENSVLIAELGLAGRVQKNMFGQVESLPHIDMAIWHDPAEAVSGDVMHSWISPEDDGESVSVFLGDATGHGVAAAFMTIMVHVGINGMRAERGPQEVMERLNKLLLSGNDDMFVTGVCVRISPSGLMTSANAGHLPIMIIPAGGGLPVYLTDSGIPLAMFSGVSLGINLQTHQLRPGDRVVLMTDGVTEMKGNSAEMFGMERVASHFLQSSGETLEEVMQKLANEVVGFAAEGERNRDDMLVVTLEYLGEQEGVVQIGQQAAQPKFISY